MKNELVHSWKSEVYCDSRTIAEEFNKQHQHILRKIDQLRTELANLDHQNGTPKNDVIEIFKERTHFYRGQSFRFFDMNRPAFSLLVMGLTGKKALKKKRIFNLAFYQMEEALLRQDNLEYQKTREQGKQIRLGFTDEIKLFIDYATTQGSKNAKKYYITLTKLQYKALKLIEKNEKIDKQFRNTLDIMDLHNLLSAEQVARKALIDGIEQKLHYKDIYQLAKQRVFQLADIMIIKPKLT